MTMSAVPFFLLGGGILGLGILLARARSVVHAGFLLFGILSLIAGVYGVSGSSFLAVTQLVVYVGGILVLLMFGVMLTQKSPQREKSPDFVNLMPGAFIAVGLFVLFMIFYFSEESHFSFPQNEKTRSSELKFLGNETITTWLLPFELISILLLGVMVGALYLVRNLKETKNQK